ncbi:MAG: helix-turn-helix domain-containing protein [Candidatus Margulisbacteria bacterium]|nr:helix-turn-helix domain-containing protein [Candidatus Margulisiibacteriota bacterium]
MARPRKKVDVQRILQLYLVEKMSVRQVAKEVGVSHDTVVRRIRENYGELRQWRLPGEK